MTLKTNKYKNSNLNMLLNKSVKDILKPKSKRDIKNYWESLNIEEKQYIILNYIRLNYFDFEQIIEILENIFSNKIDKIWNIIINSIDSIYSRNEFFISEEINRNWILENFNLFAIIEFFLDSLTEDDLYLIIKELMPEYVFENKIKNILVTKSKIVNENIDDILKPKNIKTIIDDLIDSGTVMDKFAVIAQLFNENYDLIYKELSNKGITIEDLIFTYIKNMQSSKKINWILGNILDDNKDNITEEIINKSI